MRTDVRAAVILIVDDEAANLRLLERMLRNAGFERLHATTEPHAAIELANEFRPDVVLLDLHMPQMNGLEVMARLRTGDVADYPLILVLTGDTTHEARAKALSSGASDFLEKPFDITEAILRIRNLVELRLLHRALQDQNAQLEDKVRARTQQLEHARLEILERLGRAAEFRDDATGRHTRRVGILAALLARTLDRPEDEIELMRRAAPLHDIGKIAIPDHILLKPGALNEHELAVMRTHTNIGADLLSGSESQVLQVASEIALTHHERWDGNGYPNGVRGTDIPMAGRIVALADFFDALIHDRPYRRGRPTGEVIAMISESEGHFDPDVVRAFLACSRDAEQAIGVIS